MGINFRSRTLAGLCAAGAALTLASCASEQTRTGESPAYIVVGAVEGASGADPGEFGVPLLSDVVTLVEQTVNGQTVRVPTIYNDLARASLSLALKNTVNPTAPSTNTTVTLSRYRVTFRRADGRNTPGVDVPHGFDGGLTATISMGTSVEAPFEIVRHQAKLESPLANLANGGGAIFISTIAEITFYGRDQVGNEVVATATIAVNFGDFADPE